MAYSPVKGDNVRDTWLTSPIKGDNVKDTWLTSTVKGDNIRDTWLIPLSRETMLKIQG